MIPVFNLDQVRVAWVEIRGEGFVLYGFMLYSDLDTPLVEYMRAGLAELDHLSGSECAIFVIESPSRKWMEYTKRSGHPWWKLFGRSMTGDGLEGAGPPNQGQQERIVDGLVRNSRSVLVKVDDGDPVPLRHLLDPEYDVLYDRNEVWQVARHFSLRPEEVPCIVFFEDLDQETVTVVDLKEIRTVRQATQTFRSFFSSPDFNRLLSEARSTHA